MALQAPDLAERRTGQILLAGAVVICAIAIAPLIMADHPREGPVDFHHLWTAGKMWASGESPYAGARADLFVSHGLPYVYERPAPFFYPPHSILIFGPLGLLPPGAASVVFALASAAAFAAASLLAADLMRGAGVRASRLSLASLHAIVLAVGWNAIAIIFFHNIATIIVYLALLALLRGVQRGNAVLTAGGSLVALTAPQISIGAVLSLMLQRRTRGAFALAIAFVAVGSIVGLAPGGVIASLTSFFENLAAYSAYPANSHFDQSGAGYFAAALFGVSLSSGVLVAACAATLAAMNFFSDRPNESAADRALEFTIFAVVAGLFFLPSLRHYYIAVTPALYVVAAQKGGWRVLAIPAAFLLMRSLDLSVARDAMDLWPQGGAALLDSIGIALLFAAVLWRWISGRRLAVRVAIPGPRIA